MTSSSKRTSKLITNKEDREFIFNSTANDCVKMSFIMDCFGEFNGKRRFQPYDLIEVPPGVYGPEGKKNKNSFMTTVGMFVFNRGFIESHFTPIIGYVSEPVTKKTFKRINEKITYAVLEDDAELDWLKDFLLRTQKAMAFVDILSPSFTVNMMGISTTIAKKREELIKKYAAGIADNDPSELQKLEKELLDYAKEILKDDPSMDMFNSGAGASVPNNFKNLFAIRGAVKNSDPSKGDYSIILGNYIDGVNPEEYAKFADSMTGGPYARAVKTQVGGAMEKQFVRGFQHVTIDETTQDCGTKKTIEVTLTKDNIGMWMYSYIVESGKLVELTSKNRDKYVGKTVRLRYSAMCEDKKGICKTCAGTLFDRLDVKNVGVACYAICSKLKLVSMKSFHDSTVKVYSMSKYGYDRIFGGAK